jgi:non-ribosomal peptide synthetase component E (peptide arylation enzyme)
MPDAEYGERTCAYVVPRRGASLALKDLTEFLAARKVAKFKWPERLELLEAMPVVGDSGKVDKKALAADILRRLQPA